VVFVNSLEGVRYLRSLLALGPGGKIEGILRLRVNFYFFIFDCLTY
jgi:hypothetical protein